LPLMLQSEQKVLYVRIIVSSINDISALYA
jgi:hypothetical protein